MGLLNAPLYGPNRNLVSVTDRQGRVTRHEYDALNRLVSTTYPDGSHIRKEYDAASRIIARTDENGNRITYAYDAAGRQTHVIDALGNATVSAYDAAGQLSSVTDPLGRVSRFEYDPQGRRTRTIFPDGTSVSTAYDRRGLKVADTDQLGNVTRFEYNALGRLIAVTNALGNTTHYEYDELGNKVAQIDANGHTTRWAYDNRGHVIRQTLPLGMSETFAYDRNGLLTSYTDFSGATTTAEYDFGYRLIAERLPDQSEVRYSYTPSGQRQTVTDNRGITRYSYDERDRLTRVDHPDGTSLAYTYDLAGNITSVTSPSGTTRYSYDDRNLLRTVQDSDGGVTAYTYDAAGSLVRTDMPDGTVEARQYDDLGRLVSLATSNTSGTLLASFGYRLNPSGTRQAVEEAGGRRVEYTYDSLSRLLRESVTDPVNGNRTTDYTYDAVGNRLTRNDSVDGLTTYQYDDNDRLVVETRAGIETRYTYDTDGRLLVREGAGTRMTFEWGPGNRLAAVDTDGDGTLDVRYEYDADGIRVAQMSAGVETRFVVDANRPWAQVLEERTQGGDVVSYVYGLDRISRAASGERVFYHADGLGSVRLLTDAAGGIVENYAYDAFGNLLGGPGLSANPFLFAGEQFDAALGAYYLRARYYEPTSGRFTAPDLFPGDARNPQSLHRYVYAANDPVNRIDPSGQFSLTEQVISAGIVSILASVAATVYTGLVLRDPLDWGFNGNPDALLLGFSTTLGGRYIRSVGPFAARGPLAVVSAFIQVYGAVEFLLPIAPSSLGTIWIYLAGGANFNLLPGSATSGAVYAGAVWNAPTAESYAGPFASQSWALGAGNVSVFSDPVGAVGAHGASVGYSSSTFGIGLFHIIRGMLYSLPTSSANVSSQISYYRYIGSINVVDAVAEFNDWLITRYSGVPRRR